MQDGEAEGEFSEYDIDDPYFKSIYPLVKPHSILPYSGPVPLWSLYKSIEYIVRNRIPGDIAECGVWNGGAMLLAALALKHFGDTSRKIYLYDTFEGMPQPDAQRDIDYKGHSALVAWELSQAEGKRWGYGGSLEMVRQVMAQAYYPPEQLIFVKGMVEDTVPGTMADQLALLRLDTDLYQSTYHELVHLYPTLSSGGILVIDDYGYFKGARQATDQYIAENGLAVFLNRVDANIRLVVKP